MASTRQQKNTFFPLLIVIGVLVVLFATSRHGERFFSIVGMIVIITLVHISGFLISGLIARAPIEEVGIFFGKKLAVFYIGHISLSIGSIPTGGYVSFKGMGVAEGEVTQESFRNIALAQRLAIVASGPLALFLLAGFCIGFAEAGRSLQSGFHQLCIGLFSPLTHGQVLLKKVMDVWQVRGFVVPLGVLATKFMALSLLPIPSTNAGQLVFELFRHRIKSSEKIIICHMLGYLIVLALFIGWCIAIGKFMFVTLQHPLGF